MADCLAIMGLDYASPPYLDIQGKILKRVLNKAYLTSSQLAKEKGSFPLFNVEKYAEGEFFQRLDEDVQYEIVRRGLRNGLLTCIAPTGTISLDADNVSGGIEPAFSHRYTKNIDTVSQGVKEVEVVNYAYNFYNVKGKTADEISPEDHIKVLCNAQQWVDNSISKTCNIQGQIGGKGPGTTFERFEQVYLQAFEGGAKSCTTYNINGKRNPNQQSQSTADTITPVPEQFLQEELICSVDPETGIRSCEA